MLYHRPADERGRAELDWLDSRHSFSFGHYHDQRYMGFSTLRVLNDDRVGAGGGFPTHAHADMEIVTYVLSGALAHKDSLGSEGTIRPGDVQRMSAGTGVRHSEFNASKTEPVHFLQIWLVPRAKGLPAGYEQKHFADSDKADRLRLVVSPDGREDSLSAQSDALIYASVLSAGGKVRYHPQAGRAVWVQVARGAVVVNDVALKEGDGFAAVKEEELRIASPEDGSEILLFDLPD